MAELSGFMRQQLLQRHRLPSVSCAVANMENSRNRGLSDSHAEAWNPVLPQNHVLVFIASILTLQQLFMHYHHIPIQRWVPGCAAKCISHPIGIKQWIGTQKSRCSTAFRTHSFKRGCLRLRPLDYRTYLAHVIFNKLDTL